jgi:hypothetical protein
MPLSARKIHHALVHKVGFTRQDRRHRVYLLKVAGHTIAQTLMSHGAREIDDRLIARMARQTGLTLRQFRDLINCPLTREAYLRLLGIDIESDQT